MALIHWWPLNGDTKDYGSGNLALIGQGSIGFTNSGKIGKGASFTSDSQNLKATDLSTLHSFTNYTLCCWVYLTATATYHSTAFLSSGDWNVAAKQVAFGLYNYSSGYQYLLVPNGSAWSGSIQLANKIQLNVWHHYAITYDGTTTKGYIDGIYVGQRNGGGISSTNVSYYYLGAATYYAGFTMKGTMNDFRIYDHALSAKEVKEISKGLVLHYNFEQNINALVNVFDYPTFNTSSSSGGWSHWGSTGHDGYYGQVTDSNYVYPGFSKYAHKHGDGPNASVRYLLYQQKIFEGGYRSFQAIIKEKNSLPITEEICCPGWNGRVEGGATNNEWTSVEPLGNGFYLCKVEGLKQKTNPSSANDHLVGINVYPGYEIYVTCAYLENNKTVCSDIFAQSGSSIIYDNSGYKYDGTINGTVETVSDSVIGNKSLKITGSSSNYINCTKGPFLNGIDEYTINVWIKPTTTAINGLFSLEYNNYWRATIGNGNFARVRDNSGDSTSKDLSFGSFTADQWAMITLTYNRGTAISYKNCTQIATATTGGTSLNTNQNWLCLGKVHQNMEGAYYNGFIGDFKIYATALSADDILAEYQRKAAIDKSGNMFTGEFIETGTSPKINKNNTITVEELTETANSNAKLFEDSIVSSEFYEL